MSNSRIAEVIARYPKTFHLRRSNWPGALYQISECASYVNDSDDVQLVVQVQINGKWLDYAKCYPAELDENIELIPEPEPTPAETIRDAVRHAGRALNEGELATVLHALRCLQELETDERLCLDGACDHFETAAQLTAAQIDDLAESLNLEGAAIVAPQPATAVVTVTGGVACVAHTSGSVNVAIVDYDNMEEIVRECEAGMHGGKNLRLDNLQIAYLKDHEPDFWKRAAACLSAPAPQPCAAELAAMGARAGNPR